MRSRSIRAGTILTVAAAVVVAVGTAALPAAGAPAVRGHHRVCSRTDVPGRVACDAILLDTPALSARAIGPHATPPGYGPADLQSAYKLPAGLGAGRTVAIVDAYDLPTAAADLAAYRAQYGLPACTAASGCFRKVNQNGAASPLPAPRTDWGVEIALDLDMVSAGCPLCKILLVEANAATMSNLGAGVNSAVALGATAVSNSYGGSQSSSDPSDDAAYFNHPGTAITVSSGDSGYGVEYPASSKYVTAVGGTTLTKTATTRGWTEKAWSGAGSGCSAYQVKPAWQHDTSCVRRTVADVSAVADPNTGVAVYDTYGEGGWLVVGGTSASAPLVAGIYALAGTPAPGTYPAQYPYLHPANLFDVTAGSNGSCGGLYLCTAVAGYDGPTGLGTPNGTAAFTGGGIAPGQLLVNPGFETAGGAPWGFTPAVLQASSGTEPSHAGGFLAWLNGYGTTHTDSATQTVTIPAAAAHATLSFWLHIDTAETTATTQYDKFVVTAGTTTVATFSNLNHATGYALHSYDVSALRGQTVAIKFTGTEDSSLQTSFALDDTALSYS